MNFAIIDLPIRKLAVDLASGFSRHWHGGDAYRSMYFNALSMSFPVGEQFFIDSVRAGAATLPQDERHAPLQAMVAQFVGQEATHRHLHSLYNRHLETHNLRNRWQGWAQRRVNWSRRFGLSPRNVVAVTAAYEHLTAVFADTLLRHDLMQGAEEQMQTLWRWHAAEETEHKAVAFELYRAMGGGALRRIAWYCYVFCIFSLESNVQTLLNLKRDGSLLRRSTWGSALAFWFGRTGQLRLCARALMAYLRPTFHPDDDDNRAAAAQWLEDNHARWTRMK
ncbi:metal-dependent hydrolase [Herbaspirillum sp. LeCh32-8]|uniref:metal-dependent hydrolase n=1 Tax=Herbaspirillum sp. LeCh32-8 TaxID=2821356 RepID=UPI001AEA1C0D|nr:metal-dependent hydrolase [Herbaspirillum sp. LeCh32-8]MBP0597497.1 metal-dependent hydrolase [Herbaspirillum sp. LeCh32-8]